MSRRLSRVALACLAGVALLAFPVLAYAADAPPAPRLGAASAPTPPASGSLTTDPAPSGPAIAPAENTVAGLLDTGRRRAVSALYDAEWGSSAPAVGFTGSISGCTPGTTSAAFRAAVIDRVNAYRRLAGAPADITQSSTLSSQAQAAALMMAANQTLSHSPPSSWTCYTSTGANAAGRSDLFLGASDLTTVDGYMFDPFSNNAEAGHRWWIIRPSGRQMGVGSTTGSAWYSKANALYVNDGNWTDRDVRSSSGMLSWPSPGFLPYQLVPIRWSFLVPGASYASATVTMTINGKAEPVTVDVRGGGFGQVVFHRRSQDVDAWTQMARPSGDRVVRVTVSGVKVGGVTRSYSYTTVIYDPASTSTVRGDLAASSTTQVQVTGRGGVAAGAKAAYLNVTVVNAAGSGYLTLWPCTSSRPTASTLNFRAGRAVANAALARLGTDGKVCVYVSTTATVIIDVGGQASSGAGGRYAALPAPKRVLDTRRPGGGGIVAAGTTRVVHLTGAAGGSVLPATATGVVATVTGVGTGTGGYVTAFPCDQSRPATSTLNTKATGAIANAATVRLAADGSVCLYTRADIHIILDVQGAIVPSSSSGVARHAARTHPDPRHPDDRVRGCAFAPGHPADPGHRPERYAVGRHRGRREPHRRVAAGPGLARRVAVRQAADGVQRQLRPRRVDRRPGHGRPRLLGRLLRHGEQPRPPRRRRDGELRLHGHDDRHPVPRPHRRHEDRRLTAPGRDRAHRPAPRRTPHDPGAPVREARSCEPGPAAPWHSFGDGEAGGRGRRGPRGAGPRRLRLAGPGGTERTGCGGDDAERHRLGRRRRLLLRRRDEARHPRVHERGRLGVGRPDPGRVLVRRRALPP